MIKAVDPTVSGNDSDGRAACGPSRLFGRIALGRLRLYHIDLKYVRNLSKVDDNVMSVSPQAGKSSRPFVGIVIPQGSKRYCIPLSSPKPKHGRMRNGRDFTKVFDPKGRLIAVLNFNNMVPVNDSVITPADLRIRESDDKSTRSYKILMRNQIEWCNAHMEEISRKASKLYGIVTQRPEAFRSLVRRCCDFKKLEDVLANYSPDGN